jgi:hypothetical protein
MALARDQRDACGGNGGIIEPAAAEQCAHSGGCR